jgi:nuclear pore complex protein Nup93
LFLEENVHMEWDAQRKRIYEHFGLSRATQDTSAGPSAGAQAAAGQGAFGRSSRRGRDGLSASMNSAGRMSFGASMGRSIIGAAASKNLSRSSAFNDVNEASQASGGQTAPEGRFFRDKQEKFAEKVKQFNDTRIREEVYPILHEFADVEAQVGIDVRISIC